MDWQTITQVAQEINGYRLAGEFDRCVVIGLDTAARFRVTKALPRDATVLRIALFYEARRWHFIGVEPEGWELEYARALVQAIRGVTANGRLGD